MAHVKKTRKSTPKPTEEKPVAKVEGGSKASAKGYTAPVAKEKPETEQPAPPVLDKTIENKVGKAPPPTPPGYTAFTWKGLTRYRCNQCLFDTSDVRIAAEHLAKHVTPRSPSRVSPIVGPGGETVVVEEQQG